MNRQTEALKLCVKNLEYCQMRYGYNVPELIAYCNKIIDDSIVKEIEEYQKLKENLSNG